jgi:hypothetical protein
MTSFLFKCIPCARSGKVPISENYEKPAAQRLKRKKSNEPVEGRIYQTSLQQTPVVRSRGFDIIEMGTIGSDGGLNTDTKTTK